MHKNDIELSLNFHHRFKKISNDSGHAFVYDTMALIREFIPCKDLTVNLIKTVSEDPEDVWPGSPPFWIATPKMAYTQDLFYRLYSCIPFAKRVAKEIKRKLVAGDLVEAIGFDDDEEHKRGIIHKFYEKTVKVSDVITTAGFVGRHQFLPSPLKQNHYIAYICLGRDDGQCFTRVEKQRLSLFFGIFLEDFRQKITSPNNSPFLPYLTGAKFSPRELATIKGCFDLKRRDEKVTRSAIAGHLHLQDSQHRDDTALKKALDKVDFDVKKIKKTLLKDFEQDTPDNYAKLHKAFGLEHITDIFQAYAYFGFYLPEPKGQGQFLSCLSEKLGSYR